MDTPAFMEHSGKKYKSFENWSELTWRQYRAQYCGQISQIDHHLGRVFDELKKRDLWDNTLIVFTSDHGGLNGRVDDDRQIPHAGGRFKGTHDTQNARHQSAGRQPQSITSPMALTSMAPSSPQVTSLKKVPNKPAAGTCSR
jgi:arylsulfatase A-like enzyme